MFLVSFVLHIGIFFTAVFIILSYWFSLFNFYSIPLHQIHFAISLSYLFLNARTDLSKSQWKDVAINIIKQCLVRTYYVTILFQKYFIFLSLSLSFNLKLFYPIFNFFICENLDMQRLNKFPIALPLFNNWKGWFPELMIL